MRLRYQFLLDSYHIKLSKRVQLTMHATRWMVWFRDQSCFRVHCWCQTPESVVSPNWGITRPQAAKSLTPTTHTQSWLIPMVTWGHQIFSLDTNILLNKGGLNFESRAITVRVAMPPCNLGDKYRSRLHPRSWKCPWLFVGLSVWYFTNLASCARWIYDAHCPFPMKMACSTQLWYIPASVCRYVFNRVACFMKVRS